MIKTEGWNELLIQVMPQVIQWRRQIHQFPELSHQEKNTSDLVASVLKKLNISVQRNVGGYGVVGVLVGKKASPHSKVIALRADMDGLPIEEETGLQYKSKIKGKMHACGHDAHTAMMLGVATILSKMRDSLSGTVKFLFQAAEEAQEGDGAAKMVKAGALEDPKVDAIIGLHVQAKPAHQLSYHSEAFMASDDSFTILIKGTQTHGAMPWYGVDPIVIAAQIVTNAQSIVSRQINPLESPAVLSFTQIQGGSSFNILPQSVMLKGTIRTFDSLLRSQIQTQLTRLVSQLATSWGANGSIEFTQGGDVVWNDPNLTKILEPALRVSSNNIDSNARWMGSEDFSAFTSRPSMPDGVPGFFFFLGINKEGVKTTRSIIHTPTFTINEETLQTGVKALVNCVLYWFQEYKTSS